MEVTKDVAQLEQKINTLKEMIVDLRVKNISQGIPIGHCPYAYYSMQNPLEGSCGDTSCGVCRNVFLNEMRKQISAEVAEL